jgi:hypothetical protein
VRDPAGSAPELRAPRHRSAGGDAYEASTEAQLTLRRRLRADEVPPRPCHHARKPQSETEAHAAEASVRVARTRAASRISVRYHG